MIAIVGGGVSGLAAGHYLAAAGIDVTVLEASSRPGGVIATVRCGDRPLDTGPQRTRLTPPLLQLVAELGITDQLVTAPDLPLYIHADGRLRRVPADLTSVLTTDLLAWTDRLRALLEPFTNGIRPGESVADFFSRKFGPRTYRRAIAPLFGGLFASDPADMRARHALAAMLRTLQVEGSLLRAIFRAMRSRSRTPACSFTGGLQVLTETLGRSLGPRLRLDTPVLEIERTAGGFRLALEDGDIHAGRVVLACPAAAAGRLLARVDPAAAGRMSRLTVNRLATVHLESDARLGAMGYQMPLDDNRATHGVTSQHDLFGRTGLYTAFLGGARRRDVADLPDDRLATLAADEFEAVTGAAARPLAVHRTAMPAWDASWDALDDLALPAGIHLCANWNDRPGITGRLLDARRVAGGVQAAL